MGNEGSTLRIVSTTLAGQGTAPLIPAALLSVAPLVDTALIIATGDDGDAAWDVAIASVVSRSGGGVLYRWPWTGNFAEARNASLAFAAEFGCDWSLMLDTDERVLCPDPAAVRTFLSALPPTVQAVAVHANDGRHLRERFFRGNTPRRWTRRTHEAFGVEAHELAVIPPALISWLELPKTDAQLAAKNARDVDLLDADIAENPGDAHATFYRAAALAGLGRFEEAIDGYRECAMMGAGEYSALACHRAASMLTDMGKHDESLAAAVAGLVIAPGIAELHYVASVACLRDGRFADAVNWAKLALVHGNEGDGWALARRLTFRDTHGLGIGPRQVLAAGLRALGDDAGAMAEEARLPVAEDWRALPSVDVSQVRITVTSTIVAGVNAARDHARSVHDQTFSNRGHVYFVGDRDTEMAVRDECLPGYLRLHTFNPRERSLLANLLPVWRSLPDDEVIVWLDGDDSLATPEALATVAQLHAAGAWVTYGQFIFSDGRLGFAKPVGPNPREETWRATHLKTFRAGLVKQIKDADLRGPDGEYVNLAVDQAVMLPLLEMAAERARFCPRVLVVYNEGHSFQASASAAEAERERSEVERIRRLARYARVESLSRSG